MGAIGGDFMRNTKVDMLNGPLFKNVFAYTVPIILSGILQLLFNAADLVVVGRFCGSTSLAAVGSTGSLTSLIINLFIGLSVGVGVSVAHALGAGDDKQVSKIVHTAIPTAIICGLFLTVIGVFVARPLLQLMGSPHDVIDKSSLYMQIYFCGMVFTLVYNFGAAILRAQGDTKSPLIALTIAGVVNVILNVILVTVVKLDVAGVAIATMSSQMISAILVLRTLMRSNDCCRYEIKKTKIDGRVLLKIIKIGLPAGIQSSLFAISNVIIQSSVNSFGSVTMSGYAAASNITGFLYTSLNSFSQTAVNFAGRCFGFKNYPRIKKVFGCTLACALTVGIVMGGFIILFGESLLSIYITDSPEAIKVGMLQFYVIAATYFLCGFMEISTGILRGMGRSVIPMIVSIMGVCGFRLVWIFTVFRIPRFHTIISLAMSYPISWIATFTVQTIMCFVVYNKITKNS